MQDDFLNFLSKSIDSDFFLSLSFFILILYIHHLLVVYICICPELGAISHIFSHICPEFGAKSTYICIYTPRVRDYIQQYSPELGIYVFLTAMLEFPLNLSHFHSYFQMKNTNSTIVKTPSRKTQTNEVPQYLFCGHMNNHLHYYNQNYSNIMEQLNSSFPQACVAHWLIENGR